MRSELSIARILSAFLLTLLCMNAYAQDTPSTGRLTGVLRDRTGAVVQAGTVGIRSRASTQAVTTVSDAAGRYALDSLAPGTYVVSAVAAGFESSVREVAVAAGVEAVADFRLEIARTLVLVEVTAAASARPLTDVTDPRAPRQPIPAHDGADYLKTIPGFSVIRKGGTDGDPVLRGMAGSRLGVLLDGEIVLGGCGNRMDPPTAYAFPEAYDRITVLKGPQTVLHGPGNSAGVVLFERDRDRYPQPGLGAFGSATFGSFGRNDQVAEVKTGNSKVYMQSSATRSAMSDYQDGGGRPSIRATSAGAPTAPSAGRPTRRRGSRCRARSATARPRTPTARWTASSSSARTSACGWSDGTSRGLSRISRARLTTTTSIT